MFENATLKLTAWYLLIIMVISVLFSFLVYQSAASEVNTRLEQFSRRLPSRYEEPLVHNFRSLRVTQAEQAAHNILLNLVYINCLVLAAGGVASYLMARRTLRPIQEAHEIESRFVSDASHELRTPLAAMKTELEVALKDPTLAPTEMKQLLESNLEEVNKLTKLSQTLLTLSKMEYSDLTHEPVLLQTMLHAVVERYDKSRQRIHIKQRAKRLVLDAHPPSIEELLTILIDNALKYSPPTSQVTIRLGRRANKAEFSISNEGEGIGEQDLPHIFDRFYRADNARTGNDKSSFGLGLSLAKTIVSLHHGELSATSAPGKHTTFKVLLPLASRPFPSLASQRDKKDKTTTKSPRNSDFSQK